MKGLSGVLDEQTPTVKWRAVVVNGPAEKMKERWGRRKRIDHR